MRYFIDVVSFWVYNRPAFFDIDYFCEIIFKGREIGVSSGGL